MLAGEDAAAAGRSGARVYGTYNAVACLAGALGALSAAVPARLRLGARDTRPFALLAPLGLFGLALALRLSPRVEAPARSQAAAGELTDNRPRVHTESAAHHHRGQDSDQQLRSRADWSRRSAAGP